MALNQLFALSLVLFSCFFVWRDVVQVLVPKLTSERTFQHVTFGVVFAFYLLWSADAGIKEGLSIHFLGLTVLTLMYGWRSAYVISMVVCALMALFGELSIYQLPQFILLSCLLPILTSYLLFLASYRFLPRNIFVFIFIAGFLNGCVTGTAHLLINAYYLLAVTDYDWVTIYDNYLVFTPLLAFPEGLLNGMTVTMLTVFKPELLRVFSDRDYIYNHYHQDK
ncbi:energy-coupling factor ABC transporter permease [Vibrio brasiliensis]